MLKSTFKILFVSIFIPLILLTITVLLLGKGNGYLSGVIMAECFISTLSMILLMLFRLFKKSKKIGG